MSRRIAVTLFLALAFTAPLVVERARAADTKGVQKIERPRLALVVVGARNGSARLQRSELGRSLEKSLGVEVADSGRTSSKKDLGMLSVMVSDVRTTLLWTLPDGRSGIAHVHTDTSGSELNARVVATAQSMLARFGSSSPTTLAMLPR